MTAIKVIHDGDHGGDDFITTLLLCSVPEKIDLLGVTTTFGNTSASNAAHNACLALEMANRPDIPVFIGANEPWERARMEGDDAFGGSGLGDVEIESKGKVSEESTAVDWIEETLDTSEEKITLVVTGPMTNVARLLERRPDLTVKISQIIAMGGCVEMLPPDYKRKGNITEFAEFNFYIDPEAADFVLNSDLDIALFTQDFVQENDFCFTPERKGIFLETVGTDRAKTLADVMAIAEPLDTSKFGVSGAFIFDEHTALHMLNSSLYEFDSVHLKVLSDEQGAVVRKDKEKPNCKIAVGFNSKSCFGMLCQSLAKTT